MVSAIKKTRIGIFGGTFDPVHSGHLVLAMQAKKKFLLDHTLFVPANTSPHKRGRPLTASVHRLAMLALALEEYPEFSISMAEIKRKGVSYTIDTLDLLLKTHAQSEFYLIMGADTFLDLNTWKEYRRLTSLCHILVGARPGFPFMDVKKAIGQLFGVEENPYRPLTDSAVEFSHRGTGSKICFFPITPVDISSRDIRAGAVPLSSGKKILPANVDQYIITNQLYKERLDPPLNE